MTRMPSLRPLWTMYKRTVLQQGLGMTKRDHVEVLAHNAFYFGARGVYEALAFILERGDYEELHRVIAKEGGRSSACGKGNHRGGTERGRAQCF